MIQKVDLGDNRNLFTVSVVLIAGVGGMVVNIGKVTITAVACALILGILTNLLVNIKSKKATPEQTELAEGDEGDATPTEAENTAPDPQDEAAATVQTTEEEPHENV